MAVIVQRGEIWTVAGGPHYASKPRPAVILQDDAYTGLDSATVCLITSDDTHAPSVRIPVYPTADNGLKSPSWLMSDKIATVPIGKFGSRIGRIDAATLAELSRAVILFLHLDADHPTPARRR